MIGISNHRKVEDTGNYPGQQLFESASTPCRLVEWVVFYKEHSLQRFDMCLAEDKERGLKERGYDEAYSEQRSSKRRIEEHNDSLW